MNFKVWFRRWVRSFYRLIMSCIKPYKSDKQRQKERERRRKAKNAPYRPFKKKRKYRRRHSGNYKVLDTLCAFLATSIGLLLMLPFGLINFGYNSVKRQRRKSLKRGRGKITSRPFGKPANTSNKHSTATKAKRITVKITENEKKATVASLTTVVAPRNQEKKEIIIPHAQHAPLFEQSTSMAPSTELKDPDENTPKSTPKSKNDQYIRKRMIIAGSRYCDADVVSRLQIGSFIELEAEPDNSHDKDAVKLLFEGEKVGYIAKADRLAFVTCLRLKRPIYGVITNIFTENNEAVYEYETWFEG